MTDYFNFEQGDGEFETVDFDHTPFCVPEGEEPDFDRMRAEALERANHIGLAELTNIRKFSDHMRLASIPPEDLPDEIVRVDFVDRQKY